jgi:hypothetical protein
MSGAGLETQRLELVAVALEMRIYFGSVSQIAGDSAVCLFQGQRVVIGDALRRETAEKVIDYQIQ